MKERKKDRQKERQETIIRLLLLRRLRISKIECTIITESFLVDVIIMISVVCNFSLSCLPVLYVLFALLDVYVAVFQLTVPTGQFQNKKTTDNFV